MRRDHREETHSIGPLVGVRCAEVAQQAQAKISSSVQSILQLLDVTPEEDEDGTIPEFTISLVCTDAMVLHCFFNKKDLVTTGLCDFNAFSYPIHTHTHTHTPLLYLCSPTR